MLTRYERNPAVFPASLVLEKVIFTNGGMYMKEASLRLSQRLLSSRMAEQFCHLASNLDPTGYIARHQLKSVFASSIKQESSSSVIGKQTAHQIQLIQDLLNFKGGNIILWRLSRYLQDRYACEERWMAGLKKLETSLPLHFIWGDDDSVAPLKIPMTFIKKANLTLSTLTVLPDKGHFWMMEKGDGAFWASTMHHAMS
jgi:pimeloyl-ACP methyl ester carboxylesterase